MRRAAARARGATVGTVSLPSASSGQTHQGLPHGRQPRVAGPQSV